MLETIGDFRILKVIGQGPLGTLYLGEHKFLKKRFAIKMLPKEVTKDPLFMQSFEAEIGKIALVEHLNVVKTHTVSKDGENYFLVTDFISDALGDPCNLSQYLGTLKTRLSEKEIISLLKQVAYGLDYIHKQGLSHGSLKLNNILVGKVAEGLPHLFLSDIGIGEILGRGMILAKMYQVVSHTLEVDSTITGFESDSPYSEKRGDLKVLTKLHRSFLQSYGFLAPEQKLGGTDVKCGPKSDVYSFGLLSYFLLMGYMPEGLFVMPSANLTNFTSDWDLLIKATLKQNPNERCDNLTNLMERISQKELRDIERNLGRITPVKESLEPVFIPTPQPEPVYASAYTPAYEPTSEPAAKPIIQPSILKKFEYEADPGAIFETKSTVTQYKPKEKEITDQEPMLTEMIVIEGGDYLRGTNAGARDEKPRHRIALPSFAIDIHPVTNEQFVRFLDVMGCEKDCNNNDTIFLKESRIKRTGGKLSIESGYAKHPVVGVSWYGATAYAHWVGKRLPTEAEWEIAASCGLDENLYPFGEEIERSQANFFSSDTTPVASYPANANGLFDMAGNVYEWCEDWYGYNYYEVSVQEPLNPKGPQQGVYRVLRGGCWKSLKEDLRCSHRHRNNPGSLNRTYGFRCAAEAG
jgi:formylglycine-generating enzyme required for sulfatase activity/tRNA A-37 threonylcarbamoyl transferase component Bud32